jgi:hypothetical protein
VADVSSVRTSAGATFVESAVPTRTNGMAAKSLIVVSFLSISFS